MPTYTYQCKTCEHTFDVFHGMSAKPRVKCAACGGRCRRLLGAGAGFIFKGSGFYETDYKKKGGKTDSGGADKKTETKTESGGDKKIESRNEAKTETKTETSSDAKPASNAKHD